MKIRGRDASPLLFMYKFVKRTKRRHRARLESPVNGDSFGMVVAECQKAPRTGSWRAVGETEGVKQTKSTASFFITFLQGGQGRFRFLPLGPLATPVTPLKRSLREGVRHCTPCLYCTPKAPPFMGELLSVSEAEGEHLAALGSFEPFPFRHGFATTLSPHAGTAFG